jgi:hypothetical protein
MQSVQDPGVRNLARLSEPEEYSGGSRSKTLSVTKRRDLVDLVYCPKPLPFIGVAEDVKGMD